MENSSNVETVREQESSRAQASAAADAGRRTQAPTSRSGPNAEENPNKPLPPLHHTPTYPDNWNGAPLLVRPFSADESRDKDAVERIFKRLGPLRLLNRDDTNPDREDVASSVDVAKGLIRRLLDAQIYFMGRDHRNHNRDEKAGYTTGRKLLDPNESTFNAEFFSKLFGGVMAETQLQVPHYVYVINFCDTFLQTLTSQIDPGLTIALFSLNDVLKNICEESAHQFDTSTSTAFGWLNIWLLGVQKNLICKKIPSEQHLKMFRNGVAHNQFDMNLNYMQLFNRRQGAHKDDEASASAGDGAINWMSRVVLGDLIEVNMVLKMLHNSGYILNVSHDQENMNRRKSPPLGQDLSAAQALLPEILRNLITQMVATVQQASD